MRRGENNAATRAAGVAKEVCVLLKKDAWERRSKRKTSAKSILVDGLFAILLIAALVFFVARFGKEYCAIPWKGNVVTAMREKELLAIVCGIVFLVNLVSGIGKIYTSIANAPDIRVLQTLPVKAQSIFLYKLFNLYIYTVLQNCFVLLPVNITLGIVIGNGAGYYLGTAFAALILPVVALLIASLLAIPLNRFFDWIRNRYWLMLLAFIAVILAGFYLYSNLLAVLEILLANNDISSFFNEAAVVGIGNIAKYVFPINFAAKLTVGEDAWASFGVLLALSACAAVLLYYFAKLFVPRMLQRRLEGKRKFEFKKKKKMPAKSQFRALVGKESLLVFRTPGYAFQYFAVAVLLPFMCYLSIGIVSKLLKTVVQSDSGYEIAVFVVTMFALLTNTFSATNISRDGKMFDYMKTLPVTGGRILGAKVLFCFAVSLLAVGVSSAAVTIGGYVTPLEGFGVFVFVSSLSFAEILFATRIDMNRPAVSDGADSEITESGASSAVALAGLLAAVVIGATLMFTSLVLNVRSLGAYRPLASGLLSALFSVGFLSGALGYFFSGIKKRYLEGGR